MENEIRTRYQVFKANIMDDDGNKVMAGEIVALSPKLARHYNALGFLRPVLDPVDEDDLDDDEEQPAVTLRTRRLATSTLGVKIPSGAATE